MTPTMPGAAWWLKRHEPWTKNIAAKFGADTGVPCRFAIEGPPRELDTAVRLALYRITQEALTNAVRHSGGSLARVLVRYEPDFVEISVVDDGAGGGHCAGGSGNGLAGMSERINALGGSFQAGPRPGGGFGVTARLPA